LLFRIGLSLIGLMAAATYAWYIRRREQEPQQVATATPSDSRGSGRVESRLRDAALALKDRHLKPLSRLPVLLVLGEPESGKTTTVVKSGMRPELLAGTDYSGSNVVPTESLNCWLVEGTIVVEPALAVQSVPSEWASLIKRVTLRRLSGAAGPLAVLVCFPANQLGGSRDSVIAAARKLRDQLASLAQAAGRRIPIYVVFTKLDLLKSFTEYIARYTESEVDQLLGVPLPLPVDKARNMRSDRITNAVAARFDRLVAGLARTRIDLLQRQREMKVDSDPKTLAAIYEFPRELKRIRDNTVQFLTELFIPRTTDFGSFLRGFYFCGARPILGSQPVMETSRPGTDLSATVIVRSGSIEGRPTFSSSFRGGSTSDRQWTFLSPIFNEILNDRQAAAISQSDIGMNVRQKVLLGIAGALLLLIFVGMTVSFVKNHELIANVRDSAQRVNAPGGTRTVQLDALDSLSKDLQRLDGYRNGAPWSLRWGLYAGNDARDRGQKVYFHWFDRLLMDEVRNGIHSSVASTLGTPGPSQFQDAYNALKAYLMLTSQTSDRDTVDADFLAPYLLQRWVGAHSSSPDTERDLAKRQFEFFAARLESEVGLAKTRDEATVDRARNFLRAFGSGERLYQLMLDEAEKKAKEGPSSSMQSRDLEVLKTPHVVPAVYTKAAWKAMLDALAHPERFSTSEEWVLGGPSGKQISVSEAAVLRQTYIDRYILEWQSFVKSAKIETFKDLPDAASKLRILSAGSSPLLQLLFTVSDNTSQESAIELKGAFQSVQSFMKETSPTNYIGPANMQYMQDLFRLSTTVDRINNSAVANPTDFDQAIMAAFSARETAGLAGQTMGNDPFGKAVVALLEKPIKMTDELLKSGKPNVGTPK